MSIIVFAPPPEFDADSLNQEATQLQVLDKLCDLLGQSNDGWFEGFQTTATVGAEATVATSSTVGVGLSRSIHKVDISCNRAGKFTILVGASIIGSGRTGTGEKNSSALWLPPYKLAAGEAVTVKFEQYQGTAEPIEVYMHGTEQ